MSTRRVSAAVYQTSPVLSTAVNHTRTDCNYLPVNRVYWKLSQSQMLMEMLYVDEVEITTGTGEVRISRSANLVLVDIQRKGKGLVVYEVLDNRVDW